jgi:hypothetical protein
MEELVKAFAPLVKISSGFAEILYLRVLLEVLALVVLQLLFKEGVCGQRFLELLLQPIHRNGVALFHPSSVDFSLATPAWRKYQHSID